MSEIKRVLSDIAASPKVAGIATGWGFSMNFVTEYLNPALAKLTPLLSFILLIVLIVLHATNIKKSRAEQKKAEVELEKEKEFRKSYTHNS